MKLLMIQHVSLEGPGLLQNRLEQDHWEIDNRCMDRPGAVLPSKLDGYQALVVLGGPMGAYEEDRYPYLYTVEELIREAAAKKIPAVGICLGGQLIARALGAEVKSNPTKEIGWAMIDITAAGRDNLLLRGLPDSLPVFQWHGDTFALPEGAQRLATNDICKNQAFVYSNHIWALQFHLEVTPAMIESWSEVYADELTEFAGPDASARLRQDSHALWEQTRRVREQFLNNLAAILQGGTV
jgi:GMP synthase (glutamine-hydrolysing)